MKQDNDWYSGQVDINVVRELVKLGRLSKELQKIANEFGNKCEHLSHDQQKYALFWIAVGIRWAEKTANSVDKSTHPADLADLIGEEAERIEKILQ